MLQIESRLFRRPQWFRQRIAAFLVYPTSAVAAASQRDIAPRPEMQDLALL